VRPPAGGDAYMLARTFDWWPILELEKGKPYKLHISSLDLQHGFSLQPVNMNIQVHPGLEHIVTITPTEIGSYGVLCNEYCGLGHHVMTGRIYVVETGQGD
jgi:cytochrome c oxidase subunit 2